MPNGKSKPWRSLALQAVVHLGTARLLLDLILDDAPEEPLAGQLRSVESEVQTVQDLVREIAK
jgi:hypothetical protein